jgi:hypothetical protein
MQDFGTTARLLSWQRAKSRRVLDLDDQLDGMVAGRVPRARCALAPLLSGCRGGRRGPITLESYTMSFDDDCRDAPFTRPAARIRVFGPDGELLDVIEIPEIVIEHPFAESATESAEK